MQDVAEVIVLNAVIRIQSVTAQGRFLVGYFASVESINDGGMAIELSDLLIEQGSKGHAFSV